MIVQLWSHFKWWLTAAGSSTDWSIKSIWFPFYHFWQMSWDLAGQAKNRGQEYFFSYLIPRLQPGLRLSHAFFKRTRACASAELQLLNCRGCCAHVHCWLSNLRIGSTPISVHIKAATTCCSAFALNSILQTFYTFLQKEALHCIY